MLLNQYPEQLKRGFIILESTSPLGTTEKVENLISKESDLSKDQFSIAYCPERVIPGRTLFELVHNDRIIGGLNKQSSYLVRIFMLIFAKAKCILPMQKQQNLLSSQKILLEM